MLHGLPVDDFELKTHTENREVTVYALMVGRSQPKLTRADDAEDSDGKPDPSSPKPATNTGAAVRTSMAELAENLERMASAYIDHRRVDATGLQGGWDFGIGWTPRAMLQAAQAPNPTSAARSYISGD